MKRIIYTLVLALALASCVHKELCYTHDEHALRYQVELHADWRLDWEENCTGYMDWKENWPLGYIPYDNLRPTVPGGLRVIHYTPDGQSRINNLPSNGGIVSLAEGSNDLLLYNNDTEYIVFTNTSNVATTRATTRTKTRASYTGNPFSPSTKDEETVNPPDMLFGNYIPGYVPLKQESAEPLDVTLHPLVFKYKIRFEFEEGLEYVAIARGALSGMAMSVSLATGETSDEVATLLYDCEVTDWGVRAVVNSFGVPGYPNGSYTKADPIYGLNLEVRLRNGNMKSFDFDITDQIQAQPHGGVITVSGLVIPEDEGMSGSGGFEVDIKDWGEYEDIVIPLV